MKKKYFLISGFVILVIGFASLLYGLYGTYKIAGAKQEIDSTASFVPDSRVKGVVKGGLDKKVDSYKKPVALLYVGGIILIIASGVLIYYGRKSPSR